MGPSWAEKLSLLTFRHQHHSPPVRDELGVSDCDDLSSALGAMDVDLTGGAAVDRDDFGVLEVLL